MPTSVSQPEGESELDPSARRAVLLVNTHSRRGQEWFDQAKEQLISRGVILDRAVACDRPQTMQREARQAVLRQLPLVIAGGGDGTFNALANILVGTSTALGVLPLGTGNAFARDLGIPAVVDEACRIIAEGRVTPVDIGIANDRHFVNVATMGLTTRIAQGLDESLKRRFGRLVYISAVLRGIHRIRPFRATLTTEHGTETIETMQIVIGNGRYHAGPFTVAPEASITTGKLSLYALDSASRISLLRLALALPSGNQNLLPEIHSQQTVGGKLVTVPPMRTTLDGEIGPLAPLKFGIVPGGIRVVVPEAFAG